MKEVLDAAGSERIPAAARLPIGPTGEQWRRIVRS